MFKGSRALGAAILAIVVGVVGAGIAYALSGSGAHNRAIVTYIGDSNVSWAGKSIVADATTGARVDSPYVPVVVSRGGAGIRTPDCGVNASSCATYDYWKIRLRETLPRVQADAIVVNLGVNDTHVPGTATTVGYASYDAKIDWFMQVLSTSRPVFWTNLPCAIENASLLVGCRAVNAALSRAPARWSNLTVLDWASAAANHPEYTNNRTDIHFTPAGYEAWSELVMRALDQRFPTTGP